MIGPAPEPVSAAELAQTDARVDALQQQVRDLIAKDQRRPDAEPTVLPDPKRGPAAMFVVRCQNPACGFATDSAAMDVATALFDVIARHDCGPARRLTATPMDYSTHPSFRRWA